jgi:predicted MFS family arabinose efflux permease
LITAINGAGVLGRIVPCYAADRVTRPTIVLIPFVIISGLLMFGWIGVKDRVGLYCFDILFGFFSAGVQSLFPAALTSLTADLKKMGSRTGMALTFVSFACLIGSPIAGVLIQNDQGRYLYAQLFGALMMLLGSSLLLVSHIAITRLRRIASDEQIA